MKPAPKDQRSTPGEAVRRESESTPEDSKYKRKYRDQKHLQDLLDEALDETFPASDPIQLSSAED